MKAIGYVRVSTKQQVDDGQSLFNQKEKIGKYAELNNLILGEIFTDEGISGYKNVERPGYNKALEIIKRGEAQHLIVYSLSRFSRNTRNTLEAVEIINKAGASFHSITEKIDTSSPQGKFFLTILSALSQLESEISSGRIRDVKRNNKENLLRYSAPILGFDNSKELKVNKDEMGTVKQIYKTFEETGRYKTTVRLINQSGGKSKTGNQFSAPAIKKILNNPIYKSYL